MIGMINNESHHYHQHSLTIISGYHHFSPLINMGFTNARTFEFGVGPAAHLATESGCDASHAPDASDPPDACVSCSSCILQRGHREGSQTGSQTGSHGKPWETRPAHHGL